MRLNVFPGMAPAQDYDKYNKIGYSIILIIILVLFAIFFIISIYKERKKESETKIGILEKRIAELENTNKTEEKTTEYTNIEDLSEEEKQQALDYINSLKKK